MSRSEASIRCNAARLQIHVTPLEEKGEKPLRVSQAPAWQTNGHAKDVLYEGQYRKAKGSLFAERVTRAGCALFITAIR
jgi:hypothetical protein